MVQYGFTPLHYAILGGNVEIINLLLNRGANVEAIDRVWSLRFIELLSYI